MLLETLLFLIVLVDKFDSQKHAAIHLRGTNVEFLVLNFIKIMMSLPSSFSPTAWPTFKILITIIMWMYPTFNTYEGFLHEDAIKSTLPQYFLIGVSNQRLESQGIEVAETNPSRIEINDYYLQNIHEVEIYNCLHRP